VLTIGTVVGGLAARVPVPVPAPVRLLVTIALEVTLMTYWLMLRLTRRLARWIYPAPAAPAA
jgi:antibiotic biosynthesis monooxygenase (ABM) superfamily enzyme